MKYAMFTGATGGLGTLCIKALSETKNWLVFATGTNVSILDQLGKLPNIIPVRMDVTNQDSIDAVHEVILTYTDTLDAVINFAGLTYFSSLIEGDSVKGIEKMLDVNLMGTARVNRTFFDMINKGHGRIINCSSESGWMTPSPFAGPYVLSKYAVEAYNDSLRRELIYLDIPVIKIQPGAYETQLTQQVANYCDKLISETKYYKKLLEKMKPFMMMELNQNNDPNILVKTVLKSMEAKRPRLKYRVGTSKLLSFFELLTDRQVDAVYKMIYGRLG